jgi:hypothetical protein
LEGFYCPYPYISLLKIPLSTKHHPKYQGKIINKTNLLSALSLANIGIPSDHVLWNLTVPSRDAAEWHIYSSQSQFTVRLKKPITFRTSL